MDSIKNTKETNVKRFVSMLFLGLVSSSALANTNSDIKLEKIMSDPSWIAETPLSAKWLPDSRHVVFEQAVKDHAINKVVRLDTLSPASQKDVGLDALHTVQLSQVTYGGDNKAAYVFKGDIFVVDQNTNKVTQLTHTSATERGPQFLNNGDLGYWQGNNYFTVNLTTRVIRERFALKMAEQPSGPDGPKDLIAKEQHQLIEYVAKEHKAAQQRFEFNQQLTKQNKVANKQTFYFDKEHTVRSAEVSPSLNYAVVVTAPKVDWRGKDDLMPNYIGDDGRIKFEKVRRRVADAKPNQQSFHLLNLATGEKKQLAVSDLPDFNKDVLADVKAENAKAAGNEYESKPSPRTINLIVDWSWSQSPIQWHNNGEQVAMMFEARDNKDRWIATVDFDNGKLVTQHQLHDDAWINYTFNDFGWLPQEETLYYLSEETGYSHLYTKNLSQKPIQRTKGEFEVSNLTLTQDGNSMYFKGNINHPGEYHIYRLDLNTKNAKPVNLTGALVGENNYSLSPDEKSLLITHSTLLRPSDLYKLDVGTNKITRLTDTVSEEFKSMPWQAPQIIEVPSSHVDKPIYARLYLPKDYQSGEPRRAVIFNHGAGYLQNSHKGWSGYFREFMFHNMLAQQGYVVLDMDYRASKGYGRDWRTAIYRQMGTPETQDLVDGVEWLVKNANVDRGRIGTYGGSYGGFMTFMALFTEPDLFQAGAALRPVTDWAHYNDGYTSNILNRPEDDMIAYRRSSPLYFAEGLQKPLLINAPMIDDNVFFVDVVRLVQRLIELEKENFETAIYPVEPHGFRQPSSWLDEYRRIYKLFEDNL
ncbi:S9 family peptidase [Psychrosphaera ytuae]|uniref:S9 family peptidase n=2 Tax=Psychrosphaera ytuae TaxID=2820710 RepID=A0A975HIH1_9GAMM|nr:S9 family peptidase [Psychrosphaera ytuae]